MDELTLAIRQSSQAFRPSEDALVRVVKRGTRRQRTRRIGSAVVALAVFAIVDFGLLKGLSPSDSSLTPGGPSTPAPPRRTQLEGTPGSVEQAPPHFSRRPALQGPNVTFDAHDGSAPAGIVGQRPGTNGGRAEGRTGGGLTDTEASRGEAEIAPVTETPKPPGRAHPQPGNDRRDKKPGDPPACARLPKMQVRARCWARDHRQNRPPIVQVEDPLGGGLVITPDAESDPDPAPPMVPETPEASEAEEGSLPPVDDPSPTEATLPLPDVADDPASTDPAAGPETDAVAV